MNEMLKANDIPEVKFNNTVNKNYKQKETHEVEEKERRKRPHSSKEG